MRKIRNTRYIYLRYIKRFIELSNSSLYFFDKRLIVTYIIANNSKDTT